MCPAQRLWQGFTEHTSTSPSRPIRHQIAADRPRAIYFHRSDFTDEILDCSVPIVFSVSGWVYEAPGKLSYDFRSGIAQFGVSRRFHQP
jgi:hypothetical protein